MQILVTHGALARARVLQLSPLRIAAALLLLAGALMLASGAIYSFIFLKAAREGWPVVSRIVGLVVRDEIAQRERFMRENLDAMAQKVGEMQAKLVRLEAMGERVKGLAGLKAEEPPRLRRVEGGGKGGPFVPARAPSFEQLQALISGLDASADEQADLFTFTESRLLEARLKALLVPSTPPVVGPVGSGFGFRPDPFGGRAALHTGLDFPAEPGTPILASAGGVVIAAEWHAAYGHVVEVDHGNGLVTRYAHCRRIHVARGDVVKRGQPIGEVGSSGRSTGPHLHFEVLLDGTPQDPERFLGGRALAAFAAPPFAARR